MNSRGQEKKASQPLGRVYRHAAALGVLAGGTGAVAQDLVGTLQYGPPGGGPEVLGAMAIPTMGGAGLVLMSALLLWVFWRVHRGRAIKGSRFIGVALVSGALASGLSGVKLVSDAVAQLGGSTGVFRDMTDPSGGTLTLTAPEFACVRNATDVPMQIYAMDSLTGIYVQVVEPDCQRIFFAEPPHENPRCEEGMILSPSQICGVDTGGNAGNASDIRLKADIARIGVHENGLTLYEFRYLGDTARYRGVMAQEVLGHTPGAVRVMPNGYLAVDYTQLGMEMTRVR